jgi:hypothetical protein
VRATISVDAYEAAEREMLLARARRIWRRHAMAFSIAVGTLVLVEVRLGGASWFAYLVLSLWAVVLAFHYRGWVRYGDERIREEQFRIEWRAGGSNKHLVPRG